MMAIVFLDIDIIGKKIFSEKNHRRYITHSPIFWVVVMIISYLFSIEVFFWIGLGSFSHLVLDILDWGIPYLPTKYSGLFPHLLQVKSTFNSEKDFSYIYWNNIIILRLEQLFFLASILIIVVLFINYTDISFLLLFMSLFLFTSIISIPDYVNSKSSPN
jgi:hypothetical protein